MINNNLKTQVQARIDAVTGSTPLRELLQIQTAATGLGCNLAPLVTQIQARLTAMSGATALQDLALGGILAEGGRRQSYYTVPFAVKQGDRLFIDAFGEVRANRSEGQALVGTLLSDVADPSVFSVTQERSWNMQTSFNRAMAHLQLSNGNWMIATFYRLSAGSQTGVDVYVVNSTFTAILSNSRHLFSDALGIESSNVWLAGVRETSANVFAFYVIGTVTGTRNRLARFNLTYNTVSHAVSFATLAAVIAANPSQFSQVIPTGTQGSRFVAIRTDGPDLFILDMQAATCTQLTDGLTAAATNEFWECDGTTETNVWGVLTNNGATRLYRADTRVTQALPANLTADGCFGPTFRKALLGGGVWLAWNATTLKLVQFTNVGYTACNIFTISTSLNLPTTDAFVTVARQGNLITAGFFSPSNQSLPQSILRFTWNGTAVSGLETNNVMRLTDVRNFATPSFTRTHNAVIDHTRRVLASVFTFSSHGTGSGRMVLSRLSLSEYMPQASTHFATALTSAEAGQVAEIVLENNTLPAVEGETSTHTLKVHQGLRTFLPVRGAMSPLVQSSTVSYPRFLSLRNEHNVSMANASFSGSDIVFLCQSGSASGFGYLLTPFESLQFSNTASRYIEVRQFSVMAFSANGTELLQTLEPL